MQQQLQQEAAPLSCAAEEEEKEAAKPAADYEAAPSIKKKPGRASKAQKLRSEQEQAMLQVSAMLFTECVLSSVQRVHQVLGCCLQGC